MARKPGPGICIHCLQHAQTRNWDHVFPAGWYPTSTPNNIEKWKIPTCKQCNSDYGRIEENLGHLLSFCIDPEALESKGIYERMRRAFDPGCAKNDKDRKIRAKKREALLKSLLHGDDIPEQGVYPGLGERWNRPRSEQVALTVPKSWIDKLAIKIVKGIAYIEDGVFVDDRFEIKPFAVEREAAAVFEQAIDRYGNSLSRGPGILVERAVTPEDGVSSIYKVTIWGQIAVHVTVLPRKENA